MESLLESIILTDEEYSLGPDVWTNDSVRFEDKFPKEFSEELLKKHAYAHSRDPDMLEGWQDCLEQESDNDDDQE